MEKSIFNRIYNFEYLKKLTSQDLYILLRLYRLYHQFGYRFKVDKFTKLNITATYIQVKNSKILDLNEQNKKFKHYQFNLNKTGIQLLKKFIQDIPWKKSYNLEIFERKVNSQ